MLWPGQSGRFVNHAVTTTAEDGLGGSRRSVAKGFAIKHPCPPKAARVRSWRTQSCRVRLKIGGTLKPEQRALPREVPALPPSDPHQQRQRAE